MSEAQNPPPSSNETMDASAALQELEERLAGGKAEGPVSAAAAVAAAAATGTPKGRPAKSPPPPAPAAPAANPSAPAEKPKKKGRRTFFEGGRSRTIAAIRRQLKDLAKSLLSSDRPTRHGARLFFASIAGLVLVTTVAGHRYWGHLRELRAQAAKLARHQNSILAEFLRKRSEIAKRKNSTLLLGGFNVALQPEPGSRGPSSSYRLAELEIVVECDSKESRDFLEENLERARNEVTNTFVSVDRQDLMTAEGKARLKHALQERLNIMMPKGRVEGVFFSKLVLS